MKQIGMFSRRLHLCLLSTALVLTILPVPSARASVDEQPVFILGGTYRGSAIFCAKAEDANDLAETFVAEGAYAANIAFAKKTDAGKNCSNRFINFRVMEFVTAHRRNDKIMNVIKITDTTNNEVRYLIYGALVLPPFR